jgi:hypothetical protein
MVSPAPDAVLSDSIADDRAFKQKKISSTKPHEAARRKRASTVALSDLLKSLNTFHNSYTKQECFFVLLRVALWKMF